MFFALEERGYPIYGFLQVFRAGGDQYHVIGELQKRNLPHVQSNRGMFVGGYCLSDASM